MADGAAADDDGFDEWSVTMAKISKPSGREWAQRQPTRWLQKWLANRLDGYTTTQTQKWPKAMCVEVACGARDPDDITYDEQHRTCRWRDESDPKPKDKPKQPPAKDADDTADPDALSVAAQLTALLKRGGHHEAPPDVADLRKRVEALEADKGTVVTVEHRDTGKTKTIKGAHEMLPTLLKRVQMGFRNLWLVGEAGSGKTRLCASVAEALDAEFAAMSCSLDMALSKLMGRRDADGEYGESEFIRRYGEGGVFLLDEADAAPAEVLIALNSALDNGELHIPDHHDEGRRVIKRHPEFVCFVAANTFGMGPDAQYVGRGQIDAATLDRFTGAFIEVDYDKELERSIMPHTTQGKEVLSWIWEVRRKKREHRIRRVVSTRMVVAAAKMVAGGMPIPEIKSALLAGWTPADRAKVGA